MSTTALSPAGSSTYSSNTLHVGDGTWDSDRDTFLLPNLQGLNFATTQYNGMANRFRALPQYHRLILAHGILAALTFLLIVPAAIFSAKFMRGAPSRAVKLHVNLQILTVMLMTVVVVLGYFAVGPERSLTNPHHGIGIAIYVAVLLQFIFGWVMSKLERRRKDLASLTRTPTKVWIHKLIGRAIALLGLVQIPLGLTLYGSPKVLFILYALAAALLLFAYLALDRYYFEKRPVEFGLDGGSEFYSDYGSGSYLSGSRTTRTTRTDLTQDHGRRPQSRSRESEDSHWGRKVLAGAGVLGAYEAYKHRKSSKRTDHERLNTDEDTRHKRARLDPAESSEERSFTREEREQREMDAERRNRAPRPSTALSTVPSSRPSSRPPPGVVYGTGNVPVVGRGVPVVAPRPARRPPPGSSVLSPESWEDEKYSERPDRNHTWRDRILGAGAGAGAGWGLARLFNRRNKREEDYVDSSSYRPPLGGSHNMVSQSDVSLVELGQAPTSPANDPRRQERVPGVQPMTPTQTPSRQPMRRPRPSADSMSYDDEESYVDQAPQHNRRDEDGQHTLRNSITAFGAVAGFREWNKHRKERRERQRAEQLRKQELENEEQYNRRNSMNYPQPHDAGGGRRPSTTGTLMTGMTGTTGQNHGFGGSNPELSRTTFSGRHGLDTRNPPLPAQAGLPGSSVGPSVSQQRVHEPGNTGGAYQLAPPPSGPPPAMAVRPNDGYGPPEPGSLQMPLGAVNPDPSRLLSQEDVAQQGSSSHAGRDAAAAALAGAAVASTVDSRRRRISQSQSPSHHHSSSRLRRGSNTTGSVSQMNNSSAYAANASTSGAGTGSPSNKGPVTVKMKMQPGGNAVTIRRLSEEEAASERAARRRERMEKRSRRSSTRRGSSVSSTDMGAESSAQASHPPGSNSRFRRHAGMRASSQQPIENVPPPPPASTVLSSVQQRSPELHLPPAPPRMPGSQQAGGQGVGSPSAVLGSGMSSPGEVGTGTEMSNFDDNRRRRRAERARRLEAARGGGGGSRVEFEY
ncbi:hypothetical protein LTR08_005655 [Meristemomyces frigidus]|nr:hypothetical protein LTR08_005655 [Meristemomyces frigidus]